MAILALSSNAYTSDGVIEINQACALNGGCFAGDITGFPVTIDGSAGVSYQLTSSLDLSGYPDTTAVSVDAPYVTFDLNGFEIAGPVSCTGGGSTLACGTLGTADGITLSGNADYATIRNGTIRNMSRHGIGASGDRLRVTDITARHNIRDGLNGGLDSIAVNCIANENFNDGFQFGSGSVIERSVAFGNHEDGIRIDGSNGVIENSTARNNGLQGFEMGHSSRFGKNASTGNGAADSCGDGLCTELRRFYLTQTTHDGDEVLNACTSGFHFASLFEIIDPTALVYDIVLGVVEDDSGSGPPSSFSGAGWVRTGGELAADVNCENWTSDDVSHEGRRVTLPNASVGWPLDSQMISPFTPAYPSSCGISESVWCIENW